VPEPYVVASRQYDKFRQSQWSSTLTINNSLRPFFLPDSFVSRKNASNNTNFIELRGEADILNNY